MPTTHDSKPHLFQRRLPGSQRPTLRWRPRYVYVLILVLLLWFPNAHALTLGLLGDSLTDEYQAPWAGPALGYDGFNWVEILHMLRGDQVDFGAFDPSPGALNLPNGFAYNYALKGAKADGGNLGADAADAGLAPPQLSQLDDLGQNLPQQAEKLAQNIMAGQIDAVVLIIGGNDFNQHLRRGRSFDLNDSEFQAFQDKVLSGIRDAVGQVRSAGANAILVGEIPLVSGDPEVVQAITDTNRKLMDAVADQPRVAVFDPFGVVFARIDPMTFRLDLSGFMIDAFMAADGALLVPPPDGVMPAQCGYDNNTGTVGCPTVAYQSFGTQDDGTHPTTPIQGLMANAVMLALQEHFNMAITPLSDTEILTVSGVPAP